MNGVVFLLDASRRALLRQIPSMDEILGEDWVPPAEEALGREAVKSIIAEVIGYARQKIRQGELETLSVESLLKEAELLCMRRSVPQLIPLINVTGVVVHTNLGRSLLHPEAVEAVRRIASQYNTLEYDLQEGERGHRHTHVEWLLCQLTGADAALVVNNNAGAVLLALGALAQGKEAVVSRGELVEIGGSFRIPEIMSLSGAKMVEIGTTNRTHLKDYTQALTEDTALLLKVHPSNFKILGFSSSVPREELAALAREKDCIFMEDLGSGTLIDLAPLCGSQEPSVRSCISQGVDIVTFSGDKLLGGPQGGIVVGRVALVEKLRKHPLYRALRVDKMTLAALEATLRLYLTKREMEIPTLAMMSLSEETLQERGELLRRKLEEAAPYLRTELVPTEDTIGGGSFPGTTLKGLGVSLTYPGLSPALFQKRLRFAAFPVISVVRENALMCHLRTLLPEQMDLLVQSVKESVAP
jgi:L-seryl-tRNA(Ser) seleniumtransferase